MKKILWPATLALSGALGISACGDITRPERVAPPESTSRYTAASYTCTVPAPGYSCVGYVTFTPYYSNGPFKPFQAQPGSSTQGDITISFSGGYVGQFIAWVNDPDYPNNNVLPVAGPYTLAPYYYGGDNQPGVFSVSGGGFIFNQPVTKLILRSDSQDYVNWGRIMYRRQGSTTDCWITGQVSQCDGLTASVSPWYQGGTTFDPFQGTDNYSGAQDPVEITFEQPAYKVQVTAVDPDYAGSQMEAYDMAGNLVYTVGFDGDNRVGWYNTSTKDIFSTGGIKRIRLVAAPGDYVAFQGLSITPAV